MLKKYPDCDILKYSNQDIFVYPGQDISYFSLILEEIEIKNIPIEIIFNIGQKKPDH